MQKNITTSLSFFFITVLTLICFSYNIKADEDFSFLNVYKKALLNSNIIKKNEFILKLKHISITVMNKNENEGVNFFCI